MRDLTDLTASELAEAIRAKRASSRDVVEAFLRRIERLNPALNAIVTLDAESARRRADEADAVTSRGESWGPLHGVPITLKDAHSTAGMRTTSGHPPLAENVPARDGSVAARLKRAGAILLGKTNVSPLLFDIQSDNAIFGRTSNPWDRSRTSGGSSGGGAAALAARITPLDVGSDFAGSIRIPSHFCGVYGLKPTEGAISLEGHVPEPAAGEPARSLWSIGPLARSVEDLGLALQVLSGRSLEIPDLAPSSLRVAWASTFPGVPVARSIAGAIGAIARELERRGVQVEERLPEIDWKDQAKVRVRLAKATDAKDPDCADALARRAAITEAWEGWLGERDALVCPVAMVTAFPHCPSESPLSVDGEPVNYWRVVGHCTPFNLTGQPVVVVPIGRDEHGLPIGAQLVGRKGSEARLLSLAALISSIHPPPAWRGL